MKLNVLALGRCPYDKALNIQYNILDKRQKEEIEDTLILVEHPPVITIGRNGKESNILASESYLNNIGINVFRTSRGGDVTYHGDGQIVGYPIVSVKRYSGGIREFVRKIEEVFIQLLKEKYNINAERHCEHTGVWLQEKKIAAIGLAVKQGITMHGFAFNVNPNLEHFKLIVPCGIQGKGVTSIEDIIKEKVDFEELNQDVLESFCKVFSYDNYKKLDVDFSLDIGFEKEV